MKLELQKGSRTRILAAAVLLIAAIFIGRLFYLQIIQHNHYVEAARAEQEKRFIIPASRGEIYAMNGEDPIRLVMNQTVYTVFADPATISEKDEIVKTLREVAGGNVRTGFEDLLDKDTRYEVLATKLTTVQRDKIKEKNFYGIGFQAVSQRVYPEGQLAGQVLGFVNAEGQGVYGLEGYMNDELSGTDGLLQAVTDVRDVPLTIGKDNIRVEPQDGKSPVLSIDRNVQAKVEQALAEGAEKTGATDVSAVVMDPNTGRVMAMANYPTYNPAEFNKVSDVALFNNNTISKPYEAGSVIKSFMMATAADKNVAHANDTFNNTDYIQVADRTISNAYKGVTGTITFQTAMQWSLNTGFVTLAQRLGDGQNITQGARQTMYEYYHDRFRLGQATGIQLANEASGRIISPDEEGGNAVRYSNMSFGQGMDVTMVQMASGFSALVNGGTYYQPTVINGYMTDDGMKAEAAKVLQDDVISDSTSAEVVEMLRTARQTGFPGIDKAGYLTGGKTGTSQVPTSTGYSETDTIGSYLGFGGSDRPEYVIIVQVSAEGKAYGGSTDAMPIFTDISNWMIDYLKLRPKS
ncbi:hypothetical protein CL689_00515 [Candidatus Saccharibacteria bacterium]|nr:hypothetical protein [Candidatus Saccharibacteria bacterium]MBQ68532.1 hypothetical protein [Candidatus Saccharibacteria bacterium]|tara:strand:- start:2822 stop:4555 length:1734 start_codon:yes stop_codon:yes gene_type:complete